MIRKNKELIKILSAILVIAAFTGFSFLYYQKNKETFSKKGTPTITATSTNSFADEFLGTKTIEETGSLDEEGDSNWWVNSGAYAYYKKKCAVDCSGRPPFFGSLV